MLTPGFPAPPNTDYQGYLNYIDEVLPPESPYLYGLHPNAEIGFLTTTADKLFRTVFEMQPRDAGTSGGTTVTREEKVIYSDSWDFSIGGRFRSSRQSMKCWKNFPKTSTCWR